MSIQWLKWCYPWEHCLAKMRKKRANHKWLALLSFTRTNVWSKCCYLDVSL